MLIHSNSLSGSLLCFHNNGEMLNRVQARVFALHFLSLLLRVGCNNIH